jgi:hypothetical protein
VFEIRRNTRASAQHCCVARGSVGTQSVAARRTEYDEGAANDASSVSEVTMADRVEWMIYGASGQLGERFQQQPGFQPPAGMFFRAGGVVIKLGTEVIGAIGVGGAPSAIDDQVCARAGIDKIRDRIR